MARKILKVSLDIDPPEGEAAVIISERDCKANNKNIRWVRAQDEGEDDVSPDFEFWRLNELDQAEFPYQGISQNRHRVFCNNDAPDTTQEYKYVLVVKYDGIEYDSTETGGLPPNPKPVIRNK